MPSRAPRGRSALSASSLLPSFALSCSTMTAPQDRKPVCRLMASLCTFCFLSGCFGVAGFSGSPVPDADAAFFVF
eukprot:4523446-Pleurochrysis_carterae.AAC.1